ncbi:MAG: carbonic anhydrase [Xanthomonadales bacterium]|nr:carbonic anhydrase [Xanthomonadales bacterium]
MIRFERPENPCEDLTMYRCFLMLVVFLAWPLAAAAAEKGPHWDYEGEDGPEHWGELASEFDMCSRGRNQSPIDLVAKADVDLPELEFDYTKPGRLAELNTGHAIQENVRPGNFISFLDERYELKQFHFHSPSEHAVNGAHYPLEVHFVHESAAGDLLVIGLMFEAGEHNENMDKLPAFREKRGEPPLGEPVDYNELVRGRSDYFLYNGSLTTPPCSEGVQWVVMKQPIVASESQIQYIHDLLGFDNNRPLQPHNARVILE